MWWQAHPYSLSPRPTDDQLQITVKDLGDHSQSLAKLEPGTRVAIEGPYGAFTPDARSGDKVLLVGAGVGSAPIRALLQDLPMHTDVVVLLRASTREELVLRDAIAADVHRCGGRIIELPGSRRQVPLDAAALPALVPDVRRRDTYVCGPEAFTGTLAGSLPKQGSGRPHPLRILRLLGRPMNRAPIVIGSTVFGTAAVLGFHAHPAATPVATASTKSTSDRARPPRRRDHEHSFERLVGRQHRPRRSREHALRRSPRSGSPSRAARSRRSRPCSCRAPTRSRSRSPATPSRSSSRAS